MFSPGEARPDLRQSHVTEENWTTDVRTALGQQLTLPPRGGLLYIRARDDTAYSDGRGFGWGKRAAVGIWPA